jgi:hypothetical protein
MLLVFIVCILLCVIYRIYELYNEDSLHNNISEGTTKYILLCVIYRIYELYNEDSLHNNIS